MTKKYFLFYFLLISLSSVGQISEGGSPFSFQNPVPINIDESIVAPPNERIISDLSTETKSIYYVGAKLQAS